MKIETIQPEGWLKPRGYANGMLVSGSVRWLEIAGQIAWNEKCELVGGTDFGAQFAQALNNVVAVVKEAGGQAEHIVSMTVYITDKKAYLRDLPHVGQAWKDAIGKHYPTMALVQVADLLEEGALVEIQARAALPK